MRDKQAENQIPLHLGLAELPTPEPEPLPFPTPRGPLGHRHTHVTRQRPPVRCDLCGESWRHVTDGRVGRTRRRLQGRLGL